jgi:hypothetical protein
MVHPFYRLAGEELNRERMMRLAEIAIACVLMAAPPAAKNPWRGNPVDRCSC